MPLELIATVATVVAQERATPASAAQWPVDGLYREKGRPHDQGTGREFP